MKCLICNDFELDGKEQDILFVDDDQKSWGICGRHNPEVKAEVQKLCLELDEPKFSKSNKKKLLSNSFWFISGYAKGVNAKFERIDKERLWHDITVGNFVECIDNSGREESLKENKIYTVVGATKDEIMLQNVSGWHMIQRFIRARKFQTGDLAKVTNGERKGDIIVVQGYHQPEWINYVYQKETCSFIGHESNFEKVEAENDTKA